VARRLRIQFPGTIYYIIERGNDRRDFFETAGAANAFERVAGEASVRFDWQVQGQPVAD
jgi:putative transposase